MWPPLDRLRWAPCYARGMGKAHPVIWSLSVVLGLCACAGGEQTSTATPSPQPSNTALPATATPLPTMTPVPLSDAGRAVVVGGDLRVRSAPTTGSDVVKTLPDHAAVEIAEAVEGENWLVGAQTWVPSPPGVDAYVVPAHRRDVRLRRVRLHPAAWRGVAARRPRRRREVDRRERLDADGDRDDRRPGGLHRARLDGLAAVPEPARHAPHRG